MCHRPKKALEPSKGWRSICWLIGGTVVSLAAGYFTVLGLMIASGPGLNIDTTGTPFEEFLSRATAPAAGMVIVSGLAFSLLKAVITWRENEDEENT
jgi:hypothetical protein